MDNISSYIITNDKAITKLDQNTKQIKLYTNCKIQEQKGRRISHVIPRFKFWDPLNIPETTEATNFKFGVQLAVAVGV